MKAFRTTALLIMIVSSLSAPWTGAYAEGTQSTCPMMKKGAGVSKCHCKMMQGLGAVDQNYDMRYIDMMIAHHQAAIDMSQDALGKAQHPELKQFAQNIVTTQQKEIDELKGWRKQWYGK